LAFTVTDLKNSATYHVHVPSKWIQGETAPLQ
jgi:hypothetical protein